MKKYLAHSPTPECPDGQLLKAHLESVAKLCADFCSPFGAESDGDLCGLFHDIGKYSDAFQRRLLGNNDRVDHSSAGALIMFAHRNVPAAMCIAGHHAGLSDCGTKNDLDGTFMARINRARAGDIENFDAWEQEISKPIPFGCTNRPGIGNYFYTKMLFSALTDADWLDTEAYFENRLLETKEVNIKKLSDRLDAFVSSWWNPKSEINQRRCQILKTAIEHGSEPPGIFSMSVPTGGGKTVSSMAFALHHAMQNNLRRIIYVIPYCSILEQTQRVFEEILGKEVITAHYSGAEYEYPETQEDRRAFSAENWEAPIILTTAVQFFESLYSNKPGKNRKLHNIAESVIVFDEAQMLPVPFLKPCLAGICQLVENYRCSVVLCTATQPSIQKLLNEFLPNCSVHELCPTPDEMYQAFRRVTYVDDGALSDQDLVEQLLVRKQVLCVVNSRRQAQSLFHALAAEDGAVHLSTTMTPYDRKSALKSIRDRLKNGRPCRVISTSLIEAGVDVDFPEVYRALAGLDSIIQSGGRCNREGKHSREKSLVHVFRTETKPPPMLEQNISAATRVLRYYEQADSPEAIQEYFNFLFYRLKDDNQLDEKGILQCAQRLMFKTLAEKFHLIDGAGFTVYIPVGKGAALVDELLRSGPNRALLRKLDQYSVSVYRQYYEELCQAGAVEKVSDNAGILRDLKLYSPQIGLPLVLSKKKHDTANMKGSELFVCNG